MDVLFVCHSFPVPPKSGDKIRAYHIIRHLARRHRVTVATLTRTPGDRALADAWRGGTPPDGMDNVKLIAAHLDGFLPAARMIARLPTPVPSSFGYFHSRDLRHMIDAELAHRSFGLVFVHCSSVAHYVDRAHGMPRILDFADMDSQKWLDYGQQRRFPVALGYRLEGIKLEREERHLASRFDVCTVVTPAELATLNGYRASCRSDWFPNGVDCEYFQPAREAYDRDLVVFVGKMDYFPNEQGVIDFCRDTWPSIRAARPAARFAVVGSNPTRAVRALAAIDGVTVTGAVDDVRPWLARAAVAVAPLKLARGTQNKVLEAMAAGIPVVASRLAARGVDAVADEHLLVVDDPDSSAAAVLRIMDDESLRARLAAAGRARMLSHHTWSHAMERLDTIVGRLVEAPQARRQPVGPSHEAGADAATVAKAR
jgi:sugar transferase (PEP-CTERM/EpsH1 system associated)